MLLYTIFVLVLLTSRESRWQGPVLALLTFLTILTRETAIALPILLVLLLLARRKDVLLHLVVGYIVGLVVYVLYVSALGGSSWLPFLVRGLEQDGSRDYFDPFFSSIIISQFTYEDFLFYVSFLGLRMSDSSLVVLFLATKTIITIFSLILFASLLVSVLLFIKTQSVEREVRYVSVYFGALIGILLLPVSYLQIDYFRAFSFFLPFTPLYFGALRERRKSVYKWLYMATVLSALMMLLLWVIRSARFLL